MLFIQTMSSSFHQTGQFSTDAFGLVLLESDQKKSLKPLERKISCELHTFYKALEEI